MTDRLTRKLITFSTCRLTYLENIRFVQIVLKFWVRFLSKSVHICPYPKQKKLSRKGELVIVFIKFKLVRRRGIEPRALGLRGPWYSEK